MEFILEEVLSEHILKKTKKSILSCCKRFTCKSNCQIHDEEKVEKLYDSKNELINLLKILKKESISDKILTETEI